MAPSGGEPAVCYLRTARAITSNLCVQLGLNYEVKHYKRDPKTLLGPKELYDVHPLGKVGLVPRRRREPGFFIRLQN